MDKTKNNLSKADQIAERCPCDVFDLGDRNINFDGVTGQEIIERYDLKAFCQNKLIHKRMIKRSNVIVMKINGKERHFAIEHFDLSQMPGKIFLCDSSVFIKKNIPMNWS